MTRTLILLIVALVSHEGLFSQYFSPLSANAEGRQLGSIFSANKLSGGLSAGYANNVVVNYQNPASNVDAIMSVIDVGVRGESGTFSIGDSSSNSSGVTLSHFAMKMPMKVGKSGLSFGIFQSSDVAYSNFSSNTDNTFGYYKQVSSGDGGVYKSFVGTGFKFGDLKVGANFNLKFGNLNHFNKLEFPDSTTLPSIVRKENISVLGFSYTLGTQYNISLNKYNSILLGGYYEDDLGNSTNKNLQEFISYENGTSSTQNVVNSDTTLDFDMPSIRTFGVGFTHTHKQYITWGMDFEMRDFSGFKDVNSNEMQTSWVAKGGVEYKPVLNRDIDNRKYLNRIIYRFGGGFGKSEYNFNSSINYLNANAGVSLPLLSRNTGYITLGVGYENRGFGSVDEVSENIFSIHAILTFADVCSVEQNLTK